MTATDVALVTGASRGIGQAIALGLASAGIRVIGTATTSAGAAALTAGFAARSLPVRGAVYDALDPAGAEALLAGLVAHEGLPTILVNNAGVARHRLLLRSKDEEWGQSLNIQMAAT